MNVPPVDAATESAATFGAGGSYTEFYAMDFKEVSARVVRVGLSIDP